MNFRILSLVVSLRCKAMKKGPVALNFQLFFFFAGFSFLGFQLISSDSVALDVMQLEYWFLCRFWYAKSRTVVAVLRVQRGANIPRSSPRFPASC